MSASEKITSIPTASDVQDDDADGELIETLAKTFSKKNINSFSSGPAVAQHASVSPNESTAAPSDPTDSKKKQSKYSQFTLRAKRALKPLAGKKSTSKKTYVKNTSGAAPGPSTRRESRKISDPLSIPVSHISKDENIIFSKEPSHGELEEDLNRMRHRFPGVPEYAGNPPWVTRYHPDLIKFPPKK